MGRLLIVQKIHKVIQVNSLRIEIEPCISNYLSNTKYIDQFNTTYTQKHFMMSMKQMEYSLQSGLGLTPKFALSI